MSLVGLLIHNIIERFFSFLFVWFFVCFNTDEILKVCLLCRVTLTVCVSSAILTSTKGLEAKQSCSVHTHSTKR